MDHPRVTFVIAHCGNPWLESAAEVAYKNPNVYLECSAMLTGDLDQAPKEKVEAYVIKPIGKPSSMTTRCEYLEFLRLRKLPSEPILSNSNLS